MKAKEMFEQEGYRLYANNEKMICYTANKDGKRIKFKLEKKKVTIHADVEMSLLLAIVRQCVELGWILEKRNDRRRTE